MSLQHDTGQAQHYAGRPGLLEENLKLRTLHASRTVYV